MIKKLAIMVFGTIVLSASQLVAQPASVKKIIEVGKIDNQTMKHLDILTNRFGGRLVGSDSYENAAEWMMREFKSWGLDVRLEEAGEVPVGFNRGPWFGRMIGGDQPMTLHFVTPSYTSGTKGIQRGHVLLEPKTEEEFKRMKHALKCAWVLVGGTNSGWPLDHSASADSLRNVIKEKNKEIAQKNQEIRRKNWENKTNEPMIPVPETPGLYYREMMEAGVL